jgi:thiamine-monophosphate kinase
MEQQFIHWLSENLPPDPQRRTRLGDDAAILPWAAKQDLVVTTDTVTDEVDFLLNEIEPRLAGQKALGVNLSDLAAMAAEPVAAVVSLVLPREGVGQLSAFDLAVELYRGMLPLAERFRCPIIGGDTNTWNRPLVVSVTAFGRTTNRGPLCRHGAEVGDHLLVTGALGGSLLGKHLRVEPRISEALLLNHRYQLHAGMDISDGLALDASRLAAASECGVLLSLNDIPISPDANKQAAATGRSPLNHALGDGEDFELLLAAPPEVANQIVLDQPLDIPITRIGRFIDQPGLWQDSGIGAIAPLPAAGYEH